MARNKKHSAGDTQPRRLPIFGIGSSAGGFGPLKSIIVPLVRQHGPGDVIRVWVPGCSTREEAYSIAMLLFELVERERKAVDVKIFATDTNEASLTVARNGTYAATMASDILEERLERFFVRQDDLVRVRNHLWVPEHGPASSTKAELEQELHSTIEQMEGPTRR